MATLKQQTAFKKVSENIGITNPKTSGEILLESGYSKSISESPKVVFQSKGFQELLNQIDDGVILNKLYEILKSDDKRSALTSADMLLKLKNKYPDRITTGIQLFGGITKRDEE